MQKLSMWVRGHYDRLLAVLVLAALLGSLGYLATRVSMIRTLQRQFDEELGATTPRHPIAAVEDVSAYQTGMERVSNPFQVSGSVYSNALLYVPEKRCICVDCRRPIPYLAADCPFCTQPQPKPKEDEEWFDGDGDGMWDSWERTNRLNPFDTADAAKDSDGDGFTNLAEFSAVPRTDPNGNNSFPPLEAELYLEGIKANPFRLLFRSKALLPDGQYRFGINTRTDSKTYFVNLNGEVEGFLVMDYQEKYEMQKKGGMTRRVDVSEITLKRGDRAIRLLKDQDVSYEEYQVEFLFALDGIRLTVKPEEEFALRGRRFKVIGVDTVRSSVLIRSLQDEKETVISRKAGGGDNAAKSGL
jgi:hypothetical protein